MFTLGSAAYQIYSASSKVGSTLSTLSNYHKWFTDTIFMRPSEVENLHPLVRQRLDRLLRRIQVISSPLNYCLLWSQHRGSVISETVHQCKEVLKQTYHWLAQCNKDKAKLKNKEYMLMKLDEHIREIDFCLQSLNLSLSIIQTTNAMNNGNTTPHHPSSRCISPSALLTASNRIVAMHNSGGDVAVCFGQLFKKSLTSTSCSTYKWERIYRRSTLKIYRNGIRKSYELQIECAEWEYDTDDDIVNNSTAPLTLKFDLTSSIYFTTLSSLAIDLPHRYSSFKSNINITNININDLIEDAFGWVKMIANNVQNQFVFVLKSGLDDWDKPLSSQEDEMEMNYNEISPPQIEHQSQPQLLTDSNKIKTNNKTVKSKSNSPATDRNYDHSHNHNKQSHHGQHKKRKKSPKKTSLIFLSDKNDDDEQHEMVHTKRHYHGHHVQHDLKNNVHINDNEWTTDEDEQNDELHELNNKNNKNNHNNHDSSSSDDDDHEDDFHLTASLASLDTHIQQTRKRAHLGQLLAPGGDYDESHDVTPQLMAYMIRLAIYENDYGQPDIVHHTNSTFKKYSTNDTHSTPAHHVDHSKEYKYDEEEEEEDQDEDVEEEDLNNNNDHNHDFDVEDDHHHIDVNEIGPSIRPNVIISSSHTMDRQQSNSSTSSTSSTSSYSTDTHNENDDGNDHDHDSSEYVIQPNEINATNKLFPSSHKLKQQRELPAHLNASDEELYLFLNNPPSPPVPFYPSCLFNKNQNDSNHSSPSPKKKNKIKQKSKIKNTSSLHPHPRKKHGSNARQYRRLHPRKQSQSNKKQYFAAPSSNNNNKDKNLNNNNVTISYIIHKHDNEEKKQILNNDNNDDVDLSLSISNENHMKGYKEKKNTPKSNQSMNAIKAAAKSSLLENVDLTTSLTYSATNTPRASNDKNNDDDTNDNDNMYKSNFANLSIDDGNNGDWTQ